MATLLTSHPVVQLLSYVVNVSTTHPHFLSPPDAGSDHKKKSFEEVLLHALILAKQASAVQASPASQALRCAVQPSPTSADAGKNDEKHKGAVLMSCVGASVRGCASMCSQVWLGVEGSSGVAEIEHAAANGESGRKFDVSYSLAGL